MRIGDYEKIFIQCYNKEITFEEGLDFAMPLIKSIAKGVWHTKLSHFYDYEDFIQQGRIGFYESMRDYDETKGFLPSFVSLVIKRQMVNLLLYANRDMRTPFLLVDELKDTVKDKKIKTEERVVNAILTNEIKEYAHGLKSDFHKKALLYMMGDKTSKELYEEGMKTKALDNAVQRVRKDPVIRDDIAKIINYQKKVKQFI